jgi:Zn-dependent protease with chaperone function
MWSLVIPLGFEWVLLMSIFANFGLAPSQKLVDHPHMGIFLWFAIAASAFAGVALIVFSTVLLASQHLLSHRSFVGTQWVTQVIWAFVPWVLLGLGGISISLLALELEPARESRLEFSKLLGVGLNASPQGYSVLETPVITAFTMRIEGRLKIVVTRGLMERLTPRELELVVQHERVHLQLKHPDLLTFAKFIQLISWRVPLGSLMVRQVERLSEFVADDVVAKKFGTNFVAETLLKFGLAASEERIARLMK